MVRIHFCCISAAHDCRSRCFRSVEHLSAPKPCKHSDLIRLMAVRVNAETSRSKGGAVPGSIAMLGPTTSKEVVGSMPEGLVLCSQHVGHSAGGRECAQPATPHPPTAPTLSSVALSSGGQADARSRRYTQNNSKSVSSIRQKRSSH
ncbi:unnamed protein product [Gadus morhua 'NCC']